MTDTPTRANIGSNEYIGAAGTRARNTRIIQTDPISGTAAAMAADAAAIILAGTEAANQGKRYENTDNDLIYVFNNVNGVWDYYLDPGSNEFGAIITAPPKTRDNIDVNADGNTYYGSALWGSAEADAAWTIERKNAAGTEFVSSAPNQVWNDRATTVVYNNGVA